MGVTVVTSVLFTDLVDSTALAARLGPDGSEQLRRTHFGLLRAVIEATGGTEVKNLGDGLMVAFASPSRALACATGMQQAIARHNERAKEPLGVRIGLGVGEAIEDDGDYFGDPVVEAARLCAVATGGQIIATHLVRAMAGRHVPHAFLELGELELKGIPVPVAAVEVRWEPSISQGSVPLPPPILAATRDALVGFIGRANELAELHEIQKRAVTEPRLHVALVGGEAGIGKTALIAQVASVAHGTGAVVLFGQCDEDLPVPYQPWIAVISYLVQHLGPDCVARLSPPHRAALARLVPALVDRTGDVERDAGDADLGRAGHTDADRLVLLYAIDALLEQVATDAPVVVVLDDVHWADAASLHVLRHLVSAARAVPVLLLATYRHTDLGPEHPLTPLLADLHREASASRVLLDGLDDAEIVDLVTAVAGHELDENAVGLAHALRRETDGNPFFTGELLRHLNECGVVRQSDNGRWVVDGDIDTTPLPASVRDVVTRRIARLGRDAARVLALASVIGRDFELEVLAPLAERSEEDVLDVLELATTAAVVTERAPTPGAYRFGHALIQRTLYEDLSATRRARSHHRVAELLEAGGGVGRTAELARHWVAATRPAEVDRALFYVVRAADEARDALAPHDAIGWYQQALELQAGDSGSSDTTRCRLLVGLGAAQHQIGAPEHRTTLLDAVQLAQRIGDTALLADAVLAIDRGVAGTSAADDEWVTATQSALAAVGAHDSAVRARLLAMLSQSIDAGDWERRRELSAEAVEVARRAGDPRTLLAVVPVAYQHHLPEELELRLSQTAECVELADQLRDPIAGCTARFHRIDACMQAGDVGELHHRLAELEAQAREIGLPLHLWQSAMSVSFRSLLAGRCDDADVEATNAMSIGAAGGHAEAILAYGAQLLEIRRHQGRLDEMVELFESVAGDNATAPGFRQLLASLYSEVGRLDDARVLFAEDVASGFSAIALDEGWLSIMMCSATTAVALQDATACAILGERLAPFAGRIAAVYATTAGAVDRQLGRLAATLGAFENAERHLLAALAIHERIGAPYWIACTQLDVCDLLAASGRAADDRVRELAVSARAAADDCGFVALRSRADDYLR